MVKYISNGTWFDRGTECELIDDYSTNEVKMGLFSGIRTCQKSSAEAGRLVGTKYEDGEVCNFNEFEVIDD